MQVVLCCFKGACARHSSLPWHTRWLHLPVWIHFLLGLHPLFHTHLWNLTLQRKRNLCALCGGVSQLPQRSTSELYCCLSVCLDPVSRQHPDYSQALRTRQGWAAAQLSSNCTLQVITLAFFSSLWFCLDLQEREPLVLCHCVISS